MTKGLSLVLMVLVALGFVLALATCESEEEAARGGGGSSIDDDTGDDDDSYPGELALRVDDPTDQGLGKLMVTAPDYQEDLNSGTFTVKWDWLFEDGVVVHVAMFSTDELAEVNIAFEKQTDLIISAFDGDRGTYYACTGALDFNTWYSVEVEVEPADKKFSVYVDGDATDCTDMGFALHSDDPVLQGLWISASNVATGTTLIDNISFEKEGDTLFSEDWQGYEPGDQPSDPWQMKQVMDTTFEIVEVQQD
ncbi:MAG TPA: hypothetical protein ENF73_06455 [Proteobacteria bacterium]|nr:hypothetical protein [Pseudomonadota bacterium]